MCSRHRFAVLLAAMFFFLELNDRADAMNVAFQSAVNYQVGKAPRAVAFADFNRDGKMDLAVADNGDVTVNDNGGITILLGNDDGTFQAANNLIAGKNPFGLAASDFNQDGNPDLALIDISGLGVLLGNGKGTFGSVTYFPTKSQPVSLAVADL